MDLFEMITSYKMGLLHRVRSSSLPVFHCQPLQSIEGIPLGFPAASDLSGLSPALLRLTCYELSLCLPRYVNFNDPESVVLLECLSHAAGNQGEREVNPRAEGLALFLSEAPLSFSSNFF
jgi:hypothetical protein